MQTSNSYNGGCCFKLMKTFKLFVIFEGFSLATASGHKSRVRLMLLPHRFYSPGHLFPRENIFQARKSWFHQTKLPPLEACVGRSILVRRGEILASRRNQTIQHQVAPRTTGKRARDRCRIGPTFSYFVRDHLDLEQLFSSVQRCVKVWSKIVRGLFLDFPEKSWATHICCTNLFSPAY